MADEVKSEQSRPTAQRCCGRCVHFCNEPAAMEAAFPGLTAMCSGHASVRFHDGLCDLHDVYLSYRDYCPSYSEAAKVEAGSDRR